MRYVRELNGGGIQILTDRQIRTALKGVSFPRPLPLAPLKARNVYPLVETDQPTIDPATQKVATAAPERVGDTYEQRWTVESKTAQEQQEYAREVQEEQARQAIKNDTQVKNLLTATPNQINNYIENNVTNLESAKDVLKILARAVAVTAQGTLR